MQTTIDHQTSGDDDGAATPDPVARGLDDIKWVRWLSAMHGTPAARLTAGARTGILVCGRGHPRAGTGGAAMVRVSRRGIPDPLEASSDPEAYAHLVPCRDAHMGDPGHYSQTGGTVLYVGTASARPESYTEAADEVRWLLDTMRDAVSVVALPHSVGVMGGDWDNLIDEHSRYSTLFVGDPGWSGSPASRSALLIASPVTVAGLEAGQCGQRRRPGRDHWYHCLVTDGQYHRQEERAVMRLAGLAAWARSVRITVTGARQASVDTVASVLTRSDRRHVSTAAGVTWPGDGMPVPAVREMDDMAYSDGVAGALSRALADRTATVRAEVARSMRDIGVDAT